MSGKEKAGTAYYLLLTETLFHYTITVITITMIGVAFYKFVLTPAPDFFKFLFVYFMAFGLFGFVKMNYPLQDSFLPRLDALSPAPDLSAVYEAVATKTDAALAASGENSGAEAVFITAPGDYQTQFPLLLIFYAATFVIELNVWLNFDPAGAHDNFLFFSLVQTIAGLVAAQYMLRNISPHPRSTHFGFPLIFIAVFLGRLFFFAFYFKNAVLIRSTLLLAALYLADAVVYLKKAVAYHIFIKTKGGDIWHATATKAGAAGAAPFDGLEKMNFYVRCRYVETPYSNAIVIRDGEGPPPAKFDFPYYLGVSRSQFEKSVDVFGGRVETGSRLSAQDYLEVFEKMGSRNFNRQYGTRHALIFIFLAVTSFIMSYETYKLVFFTDAYFNKYTYLIRLTIGYIKETARVIFSI